MKDGEKGEEEEKEKRKVKKKEEESGIEAVRLLQVDGRRCE